MTELTACGVALNFSVLLFGAGSNFVPVIVIGVPGVPIPGEKPLMLSTLVPLTVKEFVEVADPLGVVMLMGPFVAPVGTTAIACVAVAEVTVAPTPLNATVSCSGSLLNPVPLTMTDVPGDPLVGEKPRIET